ncbi:hypothetical protein ABTM48_20280, partial [Acinetobacter baumannii]
NATLAAAASTLASVFRFRLSTRYILPIVREIRALAIGQETRRLATVPEARTSAVGQETRKLAVIPENRTRTES